MRLTYKAQDQHGKETGTVWYAITAGNSIFPKSDKEEQALKKLVAYEDAEEQGRLVILPCKVGDIVWFCIPERRYFLDPGVYPGIVTQLKSVQRMNQSPLILAIVEYNYDAPWKPGTLERSEMHCSFGEYGDWVRFYLTHEEAEAALKGGQEDAQ